MVGFGTVLAGVGQAQPQIQQLEQMQQKKLQDAALARVMQQYASAQSQKQTPAPGGVPGAVQPTGVPGGAPQGGGQSGGFAGGMPPLDQMITALSSSGLPPDQQYQALQHYGAFASPFEKMQQQLELTQNKMQNQQNMLDQRLQEMRDLALIHQSTAERGQDIVSGDKAASRSQSYEKMSGVDLRGELNSITQRLTNDMKLTSAQREDLQGQWNTVKKTLDDKRAAQGLPPTKEAPPASTSSGGVPVPDQLKDAPDGTTVPDDTGKIWKKQGNQLVPTG